MSKAQTILVIDDSPDIHRLVRARLRDFDATLVFADDGESGFEAALTEPPDLILLDIEMPGLDGFEVCGMLKDDARTRETPIIFLTGSEDSATKVRGFKLGAVDYITKPFNGEELRARANAALRMRALVDMLNTQANTDALTGLANRTGFVTRLRRDMEEIAASPGRRFAVLFLDLDRFKMVNDGLGHEVGDALLVHVAKVLCEAVRSVVGVGKRPHRDMVARMGGDEFTVLLHDLTDAKQAIAVAERVLSVLTKPITLSAQEVSIGASVGVRFCDGFVGSADDVLRDADLAMYEAKHAGKGQCKVFDGPMHERLARRLTLEHDLRKAIKNDDLTLVYQPVVCIETGRLDGFEALARWRHPTLGAIGPDEFIAIAEDTGTIGELGARVLDQASETARRWATHAAIPDGLVMSVNISKRQLADRRFVEHVERVLSSGGLPAESLRIEIAESELMTDTAHVLGVLKALRETGVGLALDDFGAGVSALSALHRMPFHVLKIDRSFIRCVDHSFAYAAIVQAVTTLAQNFDMKIVAEGVEDADQLAQVQALGCDYAQGFVLARPMPAEDAERWAIDWHKQQRLGRAG